jgi:uncharacterized cupredoxin-like copper-binding protein
MLIRTTKLLAATALVAVVLAACGSDGGDAGNKAADDKPSADGTAQPAAVDVDVEAFCDAAVAGETAVIAASEGMPGEDPAPLLDAVETEAPETIAGEVGVIVSAARAALEEQDTSGIESDEFNTSDGALDAYLADNCETQKATVTAVDYGFENLPESLAAGRVTFEFSNGGAELHEMLLMRILEEGLSVDDLLQMPEKKAMKKVEFVRALFAPPGESDVESLDLEAGEYAVLCFVPMGSTSLEAAESAEGPPHAMEGMTAQFTVQ